MNTLAAPSRLALYLNLIRWDRPAGSYLLLWPTLSALWVAAQGFPGWHLLVVFTLGTFLMRSAGCAVNDVADREFDRHVKRTAQRPVTSGALSAQQALVFGALLAFAAFLLVLTTNLATILWSVVALAVTLFYPFTKRFFSMPQAVLGVAFSFGIPMAFSAVRGEVPALAWWLLIGNLFWVLAYDTEYAMVDRDDDLKIGIRTSAITLGPLRRGRRDGLLRRLPRDLGCAGRGPGHALALLRRPRGGRGDRAVALHADPRALARRLLPRLPAQPLGRLRGVRGRGGGPVDALSCRCDRSLPCLNEGAGEACHRVRIEVASEDTSFRARSIHRDFAEPPRCAARRAALRGTAGLRGLADTLPGQR